jgi:1,4-dihydroxy-2-naphthoyl-CoA hydrolase
VPADLRRLLDAFAAVPYVRTVGVEATAAARDRVRLRLPHRDENGNRNGTLHGGVLASLVAMGGALAAWTDADSDAPLEGAVVDLAVQFLAPATRQAVSVEAVVARRGRALAFVDVEVTAGARSPLARGLVAYRPGPVHAASHAAPPAIPPGVRSRRSGSPFSRRLGVHTTTVAPGHAISVLPYDERFSDGRGRAHDGALTTLIDCAGGASGWSLTGFDPGGRAATVAMHLASDPPPAGEDVVAEARTAWSSGGVLVNVVTLAGRTSGARIGAASVTYRIVKPRR